MFRNKSQLLPLIFTFIFLGVAAWIGYQIYVSLGKIKEQAEKQMGDKNMVFTKDGLRVNVKEVRTESYVDSTQSWFVKAWNLSGNQPDTTKRKRFVHFFFSFAFSPHSLLAVIEILTNKAGTISQSTGPLRFRSDDKY